MTQIYAYHMVVLNRGSLSVKPSWEQVWCIACALVGSRGLVWSVIGSSLSSGRTRGATAGQAAPQPASPGGNTGLENPAHRRLGLI